MRWLESITDSMDMHLSKFQETVKDRGAWRAAVHEVTKRQGLATKQQQQWQTDNHTLSDEKQKTFP